MLRELTVRNLAVVESCTVRFAAGLNVISGETGAGKSVILGALNLVLGGRGRAEMVRSGEAVAEVGAVFERAGERLEVRRTLPARGSGRSTLNGATITVGELQALGAGLLCVTGQHDQRMLLDPDQHLGLLDRYGGLGCEAMRALWERLLEARRRVRSLEAARDGSAEREFLLRYQVKELHELALVPGEAAELQLERQRLRHSVELQEAAQGAERELYSGEGSALDRLSRASSQLERVLAIEPDHQERVDRLASLLAEVEELGRELQDCLRQAPDPGRLDQVEERLEDLMRLCRKHGCVAEELPLLAERLQADLEALGDVDGALEQARAALDLVRAQALEEAERLHARRLEASERLEGVMAVELAQLAMEDARIAVGLERGELGPTGHSSVELQLSANVGEPPRALHRVASGGELSRVLLALKLHLREPGAALVFDEIDAGIGGCTAEAVGSRLAVISRSRQLICISHLPQIASLAEAHFAVLKSVSGGRTFSTIRALDEAGRVDEVARMIGGTALGGDTKLYARKLIQAYAHVA